ncbi:MAG: hypothetical protein ACLFNO_03700 [Parcubacteria group bacterium]
MENENKDLKKSKTKKIIISIVIFLALFLFISLITGNDNENNNEIVGDDNGASFVEAEDDDGELTPEQVIERMNREEGIGIEQGPIEVEIISPEGEISTVGQSRHYQAQVLGLENGSRCSCDWQFYLNENNEEYLYKEMTDRPCTYRTSPEKQVCGFTSTFIEKIGELRVSVDVEVEKQDEIVQTATAQRMYIVR